LIFLQAKAIVRTVFNANTAVLADNRRSVLARKENGVHHAGIGAFPAPNAFFFVKDNAAARSILKRAGRTDNGAGAFVVAGQTVNSDKPAGFKPSERSHLDRAFIVGVALPISARANALARKTADALVHIIRFKNLAHRQPPPKVAPQRAYLTIARVFPDC